MRKDDIRAHPKKKVRNNLKSIRICIYPKFEIFFNGNCQDIFSSSSVLKIFSLTQEAVEKRKKKTKKMSYFNIFMHKLKLNNVKISLSVSKFDHCLNILELRFTELYLF